MRWCTRPGCKGTVRGENMDATELQCPECDTKICFRCREDWHGKLSCEAAMEKKYQGWAGSKQNMGFCPLCRTKIEKTAGCNLMTCGFCEFKFCWVCREEATYQHFSNPNPFTNCGAGLMENAPRSKCCRVTRTIFLLLLLILLAPIALVLYTPMACVVLSWELFRKCGCRGCCLLFWCTLLSPITFTIGLCLDPITVPIIIIFGIVMLVKTCMQRD